MRKYLLLLVILVIFTSLYSCGLDIGINSLDKATTELLKVSGDLSNIAERLDNIKSTPINNLEVEKELEELKITIDKLEEYVKVDSKFEERFENVNKRFKEVEKRVENLN